MKEFAMNAKEEIEQQLRNLDINKLEAEYKKVKNIPPGTSLPAGILASEMIAEILAARSTNK
jgi:hypothetical protein